MTNSRAKGAAKERKMTKSPKPKKRLLLCIHRANKVVLTTLFDNKKDAEHCRGAAFAPLRIKWQKVDDYTKDGKKVNEDLYVGHWTILR
jgi:hypothetical protein